MASTMRSTYAIELLKNGFSEDDARFYDESLKLLEEHAAAKAAAKAAAAAAAAADTTTIVAPPAKRPRNEPVPTHTDLLTRVQLFFQDTGLSYKAGSVSEEWAYAPDLLKRWREGGTPSFYGRGNGDLRGFVALLQRGTTHHLSLGENGNLKDKLKRWVVNPIKQSGAQ